MADVLADFADAVRRLVDAALHDLPGDAGETEVPLEEPSAGQADLALACFPLAKTLRRAPAQIAADLAERVRAGLGDEPLVDRVDAVAGYLNFWVRADDVARRVLDDVTARGDDYGTLPAREGTLIVEHTSANPNGPLHVGRARNPIIGDTLARILRRAGWDLEVQYYVDDLGKQVAQLAWGRQNLSETDLPAAQRDKVDHRMVRYYQATHDRMKTDPAVAAAIQDLVQRSEHAAPDVMRLFEDAYRPVLDGMIESMARVGVRFDRFVKESTFVANGETERIIERLKATPVSRTEDDGALYLDLSGYGIAGRSQRFVYRRRDGTSLYATRDVAYHFWKATQAQRLVNVLGEDHKLQAQQVRICLELLGATTLPEVVFYSFVALPEGKMSTRRGRVVYLDDLIDEAVERAYEEVRKRRGDELDEAALRQIAEAVGTAALRYNIVRVQPEKAITFKWEEALNFEGSSAPFLMYAHARCASILRKAAAEGHPVPTHVDAAALGHPSEAALLRQMARFPRVVDDAAARDAPHAMAAYAQDLATALNAFYRDCPVLAAEDDATRTARLGLVAAGRQVLRNVLDTLGVPALDSM